MPPVPVSFKYSGSTENCTDGDGRAEIPPLRSHDRSSYSFVLRLRLPLHPVLAPVAFRSDPVPLQPSGVPIEGPPRVACASRPRRKRVTLNDVTQKFFSVKLLLLCRLCRTPRSVSKYQYGVSTNWNEYARTNRPGWVSR